MNAGNRGRRRTNRTVRSSWWPVRAAATLVVLATLVLLAAPARAQGGSASVRVDGSTVTVEVLGIPEHQVRVELQDDSIASTGLIGPDGSTTMIFDLPVGDYELEVITFDLAFVPTSVGTYPVTVALPPTTPEASVEPGTSERSLTVVEVRGAPDLGFEVQIVREGDVEETETGTLDGDGVGRVSFLLESGPWGYFATVRNEAGRSEPALGDFEVTLGTPAKPVLERSSEPSDDGVIILVTGPGGGRAEVTASLDGAPPWDDYEIADLRSIAVRDGVVALVYTGTGTRDDTTFAGIMTSVYVDDGERWRLALYQQTPSG